MKSFCLIPKKAKRSSPLACKDVLFSRVTSVAQIRLCSECVCLFFKKTLKRAELTMWSSTCSGPQVDRILEKDTAGIIYKWKEKQKIFHKAQNVSDFCSSKEAVVISML